MYRTLLVVIFLRSASALAQSSPAEIEEASGPAWTLQVDPLTTALGYVHLQIERRVAPHWSVYIGPHLRLFSPPFGEAEDYRGYGLELGLRYFFQGTAPEGWWVGIRGVLAALRTENTRRPGGYASALGGYTAIFGHFVLSGGIGIQYLHYTIEGLGPKRVFVALHTALGVAF